MKYNWTQHKKRELNIQIEGMGECKDLDQKKELEKSELSMKQDKISEELRNFDRILGDRQLLQSQIEMNISKLDIHKGVKQMKTGYEEKAFRMGV